MTVKTTNYITPIGRASYANVWEMKPMPNGVEKYSMAILFPKTDKGGIEEIRKCIVAAIKQKFGEDKAKWPKKIRSPLQDGDSEEHEDKDECYRGHYFMNASSTRSIGIVGPDARPIMDQDEFYSGCYCRASVNFYGYDKAGKKGVGVGLNNVMKVKDGDRLDGKRSAESEFGDYAVETESSSDEEFLDG